METRIESFLGMPAVIHSEPMRDLLRTVERLARSPLAVLITGESGSGKEVIARAIHHFSNRSGKNWVDLSCAALPEHLVESELFGYERGAFSGADSMKQGLFEVASGGSIFLDEIGELPPRMQVKLLRVLDGVPYYRLGGVRKVAVDTRVIAATNRNLEAAVAEGGFRSDLFYRLGQVHLHIPPLRERRDDIAPLARHFLEQHVPGVKLSDAAAGALREYTWPGNIRELRNVVVKAAVMTGRAVVEAADLRLPLSPAAQSPEGAIESMERRMIVDVLNKTGGHHRRAANVLGISSRTLSRKLKSYGLPAQEALAGNAHLA
jgi:transcriptional regulator with PAS, ATPase and Fis domain